MPIAINAEFEIQVIEVETDQTESPDVPPRINPFSERAEDFGGNDYY
jgi:hypothetical protein